MQTITETINQLTHEELKAYCIQQNQSALDLMAKLENQRVILLAAGRLASICTTLSQENAFLRQSEVFMNALNQYDNEVLKQLF